MKININEKEPTLHFIYKTHCFYVLQNTWMTSWSWSLKRFSMTQLHIYKRLKNSTSHQPSHRSIHDQKRQQWFLPTSHASIQDRSEAHILPLFIRKLLPYPQDDTTWQYHANFTTHIPPAPGHEAPVCTISVTTKTQRRRLKYLNT